MKAPDHWLATGSDNGGFGLALLAALALELGALALLLPLIAQPQPPAEIRAPVRLTIEAPAPKPPAPKPPVPKPPVQKPVPPPPPMPVTPTPPLPAPPPPLPPPRLPRVAHHMPPPRPVQPAEPPAPTPTLEPPAPKPPAPQPLPPAPPSAGAVDLFREAVRNAVQRAANGVYPQGAQASGQVRITISYLNGHAISVTLAHSSGYPILDSAALTAGRIAAYPPPPAAFANRVFPWTVTVIFEPAPSVDGD